MELLRTNNSNTDFQALCSNLNDELNERYGILQSKYDNLNVIEKNETVLVGYLSGEPVACGCFKTFDDKTIEIKRMYIKSEYRGKGLSSHLLSSLEIWAEELGYTQALLETGKRQPEAIKLYQKQGYQVTEKYGPYIDLDNSVCMKKTIKTNK